MRFRKRSVRRKGKKLCHREHREKDEDTEKTTKVRVDLSTIEIIQKKTRGGRAVQRIPAAR